MNASERSQLLAILRCRSDAIAARWYEAIAQTEDTPLEPDRFRVKLASLTRQFTEFLLAEPFDPLAARETGASLAGPRHYQPEPLGCALKVLPGELLRDLSQEQTADLQPRLFALLGSLAEGFCERAQRIILDEQVTIHRALSAELESARQALQQNRGDVRQKVGNTAGLSTALEGLQSDMADRARLELALLGGSACVAAITDCEGIIVDVNEAFSARFGWTVDDMVGTCIWDHLPPDLARTRRRHMQTVIESGKPLRVEDERLGTWFDNVVYPIFDEEGEVYRVAALALDITERKQAETALKESERTARALLRAPTDIAFLVDAQGTIIDLSETFALRFGKEVDELVGMCVWDLLPPPLAESRKGHADTVVRTGRPVRGEDERQGRWFDNVAYPVLNEQGEVFRVAVLARDITERKQLEQALRKSESTARALLHTPTDAAVLLDRDGTILDLNETFANRFGKTVTELAGTRVWDLLPANLLASRREHMETVFRTGQLCRFEDERDGMWNDNVLHPAFDDEGNVSSVALLGRDITARKRLERELRGSLEEVERGRQLLFALALASHAVLSARTPDEVYQAISQQVRDLGFHAVIFRLNPDRSELVVDHASFDSQLRLAVEEVFGLPLLGYTFSLRPGALFHRALVGARPIHTNNIEEAMAETLPQALRPHAGSAAGILGLEQVILSPLVVQDETYGLLVITGSDLRESDTTVMAAFADSTAIALANARLNQEAREWSAELERRVRERTKELEYEAGERRRSQDLAEQSHRLLLVLSRAAQVVQRASTPEDIYECIGNEVAGAGLNAIVFALGEDLSEVRLIYVTWPWPVMRNAFRLAGLSEHELRLPLRSDGFLQPVIERRESAFCQSTAHLVSRGIPGVERSMVEQQVGLLGLQRSIFAPLVIGGKVWGILCIGATNLTAGDVPAVALFANQTSIALQKARLLSELQASHRQLRQLAHEVVNAQEVERRHLASALHDEAGQALTALRINLELIEEELPPKCQSLQERVGDAAGLAASTMHRIRAIAQDLRPPALDALGLSPTLEDACRRFSRHTGLDIDYSGARAPALAEEVNICLYRLLQEALANVARHAEAHHVQVTLQCDDEAISLSVEDDGRGFDVLAQQDAPPTPDLPGGIGLLGMRERVESLGGRLAIRSLPGHGTLLATHIPFKEAGHGT